MKRSKITGHLVSGRGSCSNPTLALLRRVKSSRTPNQSVTSKPRTVARYASPGTPSLPRLRFLADKPDED